MLKKLFPRVHGRYLSLPLFGHQLNGFILFLNEQGYPSQVIKKKIRAIPRIDLRLCRAGCIRISSINRQLLSKCILADKHSQKNIETAATVRLLERYLEWKGFLHCPAPKSPIDRRILEYRDYLVNVRGFATFTVCGHLRTVQEFLVQLSCPRGLPARLKTLTPLDSEEFIKHLGKRLNRGTLQHSVAHLRAFLRYLSSREEAPSGLDSQIDTPRVYRGEKLPRALPWTTVQQFLKSIDRSSPMGLRDYAMFLLMTTYGLRGSEVAGLKLDDIDWRAGVLHIRQRKTASPLILPLTSEVGNSILDYLKRGRAQVPYREVFVRHRAPSGILKPTAVVEAFQKWSGRSGLMIPYQGAHCLRHSYALHLLRHGTSMKTIGDVLGHKNFESTFIYLRLSVEDLRSVPLELPSSTTLLERSRS